MSPATQLIAILCAVLWLTIAQATYAMIRKCVVEGDFCSQYSRTHPRTVLVINVVMAALWFLLWAYVILDLYLTPDDEDLS